MRPLRPSQFGQAMHCGLSAHAPYDRPPESGDAAREGTCAAWVAEVVRNGDATSADDLVGRVHENGWEVDASMAKYVNDYLAILLPDGQAECFMQIDVMEGTADDIHINHATDHVTITDLKFGYEIVDPFQNWQLLSYLFLYVQTTGHYPTTVTLAIYQPRATHQDGPHREWHLTNMEYQPYLDRIGQRIYALTAGDDMGNPGKHCNHCLNAVGCRALTESVYKVVDLTTQSRVYHQPDAQQLGDELEMLQRMEELLKARRRAVEEEAVYRLNNGGYVPGWVMTPRYGKAKFTVDAPVIEMLTGVSAMEEKIITPAELQRRGVKKEMVKSITTTPRIGFKLDRFEGEDKIAARFRAAQLN